MRSFSRSHRFRIEHRQLAGQCRSEDARQAIADRHRNDRRCRQRAQELAFFGLSQTMRIFVIAFGAIWPMLLSTVHAFAAEEPPCTKWSSLHLSCAAVIFKIGLPSACADIFAGMRISVTVALILSMVCEMLAGLYGLGQWILLSARMFRSADLFAGVILLGVIGYVSALAVAQIERKLLIWRTSGH